MYKSELQRLRRGSRMEDYLRKVKELADNLQMAGCPLANDNLVTQTLVGLDAEYGPIVVQLAEKTTLSWVELQTSLLTYESRLEHWSSLGQYTSKRECGHW